MEREVNSVSLRDACSTIAIHLRGRLKKVDEGYKIEFTGSYNNFVTLSIWLDDETNRASLEIDSTLTEKSYPVSFLRISSIENLYLTWDSKRMISFCFVEGGKYTLINLTGDPQVMIINDIDSRGGEIETEPKKRQYMRRIFYLIQSPVSSAKTEQSAEEEG